MKAPLDQAYLSHPKRKLIFGGTTFQVMALFGEHADRLYEYVSSASGSPVES